MIRQLENYLEARWPGIFPEKSHPNNFHCLLAGHERTRNKLLFVLVDGEPDPVIVAKIARDKPGARTLQREFENLAYVNSRACDALTGRLPRPIGMACFGEDTVLLETALGGENLQGIWNELDTKSWIDEVARCVEECTRFLIELQQAVSDGSSGNTRISELFEHLWQVFNNLYEVTGAESAAYNRIHEEIRRIGDPTLPGVFSHGDFWAGNFLRKGNGELGLLDWEFARRDGLPFWDLFLFLSSVSIYSPWGRWGDDFSAGFRYTLSRDSKLLRMLKESLITYAQAMQYPESWIVPLYRVFLFEMSIRDYQRTGTASKYDLNWRNCAALFHNFCEKEH